MDKSEDLERIINNIKSYNLKFQEDKLKEKQELKYNEYELTNFKFEGEE